MTLRETLAIPTRSRTTVLAAAARSEPSGSNADLAALFERVAGRVYAYFVKRLRDKNEAEELAQRTFFLLVRSLRDGTYDASRSFNVWLWLKAHSVYVDACRERDRRPERIATDIQLHAAERRLDPALDAGAILATLRDRLGEETHEIFLLHHEAELTHAEIAEAVGRDRKTVAKRLDEAARFLERLARGA